MGFSSRLMTLFGLILLSHAWVPCTLFASHELTYPPFRPICPSKHNPPINQFVMEMSEMFRPQWLLRTRALRSLQQCSLSISSLLGTTSRYHHRNPRRSGPRLNRHRPRNREAETDQLE
jgi:hypothetical protein